MRKQTLDIVVFGIAALAAGSSCAARPFTLELYVKPSQPIGACNKPGSGPCPFAGTRTVDDASPDAGWSLGQTGDGRIRFVVSDGVNRTVASCRAEDSHWAVGEWNHVAIRTTEKGSADLFVNGVASCGCEHYAGATKTNTGCVADVNVNCETLSGKADPVSGKAFSGKICGRQFHDFALSDDHVRMRVRRLGRLSGNWRESRDCETGEATWIRRLQGKDSDDILHQLTKSKVAYGGLWQEPPRVVVVDVDAGGVSEALRKFLRRKCPATCVLTNKEATRERIAAELRRGIDVPSGYRLAYQLQVTRGRVPKPGHLAEIVGLLERLGYDQLQLYMENHYPYLRNPGVSAGDAAIGPDEWKALDALAKSKGIELVPSQESFGHLDSWMTHPSYRHLAEKPEGDIVLLNGSVRKTPSCLCPTDEKSLAFVLSLWDELLPNFTSGLFNIGCDEVADIEGVTGRSGAAIARHGSVAVFADFLNKLVTAANARGKTPMFWGDMITYAGEGALRYWRSLPPGCIVLNWDYEGAHACVYDRRYELMRQGGRRVYSCPGTSGWGTIAGRTQNMMDNVDAHLSAGLKYGAEGLLLTDWGGGPQPQPFIVSVPAIVYCSERVRKGLRPDFAGLAAAVDAALGARVGEALVRYGNLYRLCGKRKSDCNELFSILIQGRNYVRSPGVSDMTLDAVVSEYENAKRTCDLTGAPDWVKDEMAAVELMLDALVMRIRGEHDEIPALAPKYEELWRRGYREGRCRVASQFLFHK